MDGRHPTNDFLDARDIKAALHDRAAFGRVYDAAVRPVYAFCLAHSDDVSDADDLLAQTFIRALARLDADDGQTAPLVWLLTIAAAGAWERPAARHGDALIEAAGGVVGAVPGDHPPGTTPAEAVARWTRAAEVQPRTVPISTPRPDADQLDDLRSLRRGVEAPALAPDPATVADLRALLLDQTMSPEDLLDLNEAYTASRHEIVDDDGSPTVFFDDEDAIFDDTDDVDQAPPDERSLDDAGASARAKAAAVRQLKRDVRGLPPPASPLSAAPASAPRSSSLNLLVLSVGVLLVVVVVLLAVVVVLLIRR